jgi:hypothetical protein
MSAPGSRRAESRTRPDCHPIVPGLDSFLARLNQERV